ncbi:hypothetical protein [Anaerospora sp.]|uniref:hypothetical protein n=1 Tax=Anaerospora sp. TaxID=1960278 RepID=UPI0028986728|nr:hypothetical protein [Anaerospora sp.]
MSTTALYDKYLKQSLFSTFFSNIYQPQDKHTDWTIDDDEWDTYVDFHRDEHRD